MTEILLKFYNLILVKQYYPKQWIKVLDVTLEKEKGSVLGKLRVIYLMEADFQLIIRIFLGQRN